MIQEHLEVVKFLLDNGAEPNVRTFDGLTPLMQAAVKNADGMMKIPIAKGATCNVTSKGTGTTQHYVL